MRTRGKGNFTGVKRKFTRWFWGWLELDVPTQFGTWVVHAGRPSRDGGAQMRGEIWNFTGDGLVGGLKAVPDVGPRLFEVIPVARRPAIEAPEFVDVIHDLLELLSEEALSSRTEQVIVRSKLLLDLACPALFQFDVSSGS